MRISLDGLSDYLPTSLSVAEIGERLTATGLEVEKSEVFDALPGGLRGIVVGEVREGDATSKSPRWRGSHQARKAGHRRCNHARPLLGRP